jgi:hypothetical protein
MVEQKNSKMVILGENIGRRRNDAGEMTITSTHIEVGLKDTDGNINAVGSVSINGLAGQFNVNAPIEDVGKIAEAIGKLLCGVR